MTTPCRDLPERSLMGERTGITWTDHTFNPWIGCTKISAGCANCYAETLGTTRMKGQWGPGMPRRIMSEHYWNDMRRWNRKAQSAGVRRRVFVASLADIGDDDAPSDARQRLYREIAACTGLEFLLLTKRTEC